MKLYIALVKYISSKPTNNLHSIELGFSYRDTIDKNVSSFTIQNQLIGKY